MAEEDLLSAQERGVAELIGEGLSDEQVARQLCLSMPTVNAYVKSIMTKLRLTHRRELREWFGGG